MELQRDSNLNSFTAQSLKSHEWSANAAKTTILRLFGLLLWHTFCLKNSFLARNNCPLLFMTKATVEFSPKKLETMIAVPSLNSTAQLVVLHSTCMISFD